MSVPTLARPRIVAHRGASHDQPENTLAAFRRAWELGVEGCELDVRLSKDGHAVVIHDANTKRVGGVDRAVAEQTLLELRSFEIGGGQKIPTIAEVLAEVPTGRTLFVEIKSKEDTVPAIARQIAAVKHGASIALQGFDPEVLVALANELPGTPAYWTVDPPRVNDVTLPYTHGIIDEAVRRKLTGLALLFESVDDNFIAAARAKGLEIDVWTINDAAQLATWVAKRDVRWIETDRPDLVPTSNTTP